MRGVLVTRKVLLITMDETHRFLYGSELREYYEVQHSPMVRTAPEGAEGVVYDLPMRPEAGEFQRIEKLDVPTVVLSPSKHLPAPKASRVRVLFYPVEAKKVVRVLGEMGLNP